MKRAMAVLFMLVVCSNPWSSGAEAIGHCGYVTVTTPVITNTQSPTGSCTTCYSGVGQGPNEIGWPDMGVKVNSYNCVRV